MAEVKQFNLIGQKLPEEILSQSLLSGKLAGTYLFYGPPGVGKFLLAWECAKSLLCSNRRKDSLFCNNCQSCAYVDRLSHPDLYLLFPQPTPRKGKEPKESQEFLDEFRQAKIKEPYEILEYSKPINISRDAIRNLKRELYRKPFLADRKVVIIDRAESMRIDSVNLLLKILEEPPGDTTIFLTTSQLDRILPTVVSRSQKIRFSPLSPETIQLQLKDRFSVESDKAEQYARLAEGSLGNAINYASGRWENITSASVDLWLAILDQKTEKMGAIIDALDAEKDRSQILILLKMWQYLARDAALLNQKASSNLVINRIHAGQLSRLANRFSPRVSFAAFELIDRARLDFYRNLGIKSLLTGLSLALKEILSPN